MLPKESDILYPILYPLPHARGNLKIEAHPTGGIPWHKSKCLTEQSLVGSL